MNYNNLDILVIYKHTNCKACKKIVSIIRSFGLKCKKKIRDNITKNDFSKEKLVIIVGGDGTTLKVCQMINNDSIVFSVNSYPKLTEGFLTRANIRNFKRIFQRLMNNKIKIRKLPRLEVKINNKTLLRLALNEVSISNIKPYLMFVHQINSKVEKSTGILVCTPIGSTAWCRSAGGKVMPIPSKKLQYVIREPYNGRIFKVKKKSGLVNSFRVKALSPGIIVFDSCCNEYRFRIGDIITIMKSRSHINFVDK